MVPPFMFKVPVDWWKIGLIAAVLAISAVLLREAAPVVYIMPADVAPLEEVTLPVRVTEPQPVPLKVMYSEPMSSGSLPSPNWMIAGASAASVLMAFIKFWIVWLVVASLIGVPFALSLLALNDVPLPVM
ncbi:hypothetical protein R83H12_02726 [Fibrobacteria bacterium R8-3-H12]